MGNICTSKHMMLVPHSFDFLFVVSGFFLELVVPVCLWALSFDLPVLSFDFVLSFGFAWRCCLSLSFDVVF